MIDKPFMPNRRFIWAALVAPVLWACTAEAPPAPGARPGAVALVIHGGAGNVRPESLDEERRVRYRTALRTALDHGHEMLRGGSASVDVVEAVIRILEDDELFNAGRGAVFTAEGRNELDASIMNGSTTLAGAVAGVTRVRHPITAARTVMDETAHVLLAGPGADAFAESRGLEMVEPDFFYTERRWQSLERAREREASERSNESTSTGGPAAFGTVGAVALDREGRISAGTSTGGMTNKKHGRIGDSPIVGAGTYANESCGVSATGHGEYFIRFAVAFDVCAGLRDPRATLEASAERVIHDILTTAGGEGGIIALDAAGNLALVFNTTAMYRGWVLADGEPYVAIFQDN